MCTKSRVLLVTCTFALTHLTHGKFLRKDLPPSFTTFDNSGKNAANLLSHPVVTPLMLVTTYYHPRSPPHPNAIDEIERAWPEDGLPKMLEGYDHDDPMGGSPAGLYYSSDEGEEHILVWHAPKGSDNFRRRVESRGERPPRIQLQC